MYQAHGGYYLMMAVGFMGLGFVIIYGAERITRWAFNEPSPYSITEDEDAPSQSE